MRKIYHSFKFFLWWKCDQEFNKRKNIFFQISAVYAQAYVHRSALKHRIMERETEKGNEMEYGMCNRRFQATVLKKLYKQQQNINKNISYLGTEYCCMTWGVDFSEKTLHTTSSNEYKHPRDSKARRKTKSETSPTIRFFRKR